MNKLFYLSDDEVQSQLAAKCNLLVHIGLETFQYAVTDAVRDHIKVLAEFEIPVLTSLAELIKAIENLPESAKLFKYRFNKVKVSYDTFNYTFVPSELYLPDDDSEYGKFVKPSENSKLLVNHIRSGSIKNIGSIDSDLHDTLNRIFHAPRICNQASSFVEGMKKLAGSNRESFFIDVKPRHIQTGVLKNSELIFYNIFECVNADEFNYYLLAIIEQLGIETGQAHVFLSGNISEADEFYERTRKYFSQISFTDTRNLIKYGEKLEKVPSHTYFSLISLDLCE